ncbi:hypothetical protein T07_10946 [Trichinella nelsoni]|uniref:Uncharacterized protein n=1 Tax=Trichinella nelsoni TaxID=6336 RepID=A0A0V0SJF9_9BILA|nr:hypothetical protein T07_10946 [Trichinella nelsoni]
MSACSVILDQRNRRRTATRSDCNFGPVSRTSVPIRRTVEHYPALTFTLIVFVERMIMQIPCSSWYRIYFLCPSMGKEGADNSCALLVFLWISFQLSQPTQRHFYVVWQKGVWKSGLHRRPTEYLNPSRRRSAVFPEPSQQRTDAIRSLGKQTALLFKEKLLF